MCVCVCVRPISPPLSVTSASLSLAADPRRDDSVMISSLPARAPPIPSPLATARPRALGVFKACSRITTIDRT